MGGTAVVPSTRICPHCRQPTRAEWPVCDGCARSLPAYRPQPDLRLMAEMERWERANPRPLDGAAVTRRTLKWLWAGAVVLSALDLHFGRRIGPVNSVWDDLAVGSLTLAFAATLVGVFVVGFLSARDPAPAWRRERAALEHRLGIGSHHDG
ncbi:MAG TPA: hypothetical protein VGL44_17010 [Gaiellales bacterium]|jgi:hypothetical protein